MLWRFHVKQLTTLTEHQTGVVLFVKVHSLDQTSVLLNHLVFSHNAFNVILKELNKNIFYK